MVVSAAPMPARWHTWAEDLLLQPETLAQMARVVGDTFHVLDPATFADNLAAFSAAFDDCGVDGRIRYGYKANKARAFVRECASAASAARGRFGVDVASVEEFGAALTAGVRGEEIVVTGLRTATKCCVWPRVTTRSWPSTHWNPFAACARARLPRTSVSC